MSKVTESQREEKDSLPVVYLGYIEDGDIIERELEPEQINEIDDQAQGSSATSSNAQSIPPWLVNKIGGLPVFPYNGSNIKELESALDSMSCKNCKSPCILVFQMTSAIDDSTLDRVLQVYTCVDKNCIRHSWFTLRCVLSSKSAANQNENLPKTIESKKLDYILDPVFGSVLVCRERAFFKPYYVSVMEEPTGRENFAKNNLGALKLAAKFSDPDLKPAPIEAKYKNLKNYKPPQPPSHLSDLEDFEKFQMERLYGNDKDMYRFYKRLSRFQAQVVRYDWEGQPLVNSSKIKFNIMPCPSCGAERRFEFQLMSALINYLKADQEFDRESQDFSSIVAHCCAKNCSGKPFNIEDTYFMPDPDSRIFNKVKQRMLDLKLGKKSGGDNEPDFDDLDPDCIVDAAEGASSIQKLTNTSSGQQSKSASTKSRKKKNKK